MSHREYVVKYLSISFIFEIWENYEKINQSILTHKLTNMSPHNQNTQVTCRLDSNED